MTLVSSNPGHSHNPCFVAHTQTRSIWIDSTPHPLFATMKHSKPMPNMNKSLIRRRRTVFKVYSGKLPYSQNTGRLCALPYSEGPWREAITTLCWLPQYSVFAFVVCNHNVLPPIGNPSTTKHIANRQVPNRVEAFSYRLP